MKKIFIILTLFLTTHHLTSNQSDATVAEGQTWQLIKKSNKLEHHNSKVLYFFSVDALYTHYGRRGGEVAVIDTRNLVRINKGDRIEIIKPRHQGNILEVKLLDGFEKNRNYYVITDDLHDDYVVIENQNEA